MDPPDLVTINKNSFLQKLPWYFLPTWINLEDTTTQGKARCQSLRGRDSTK